MQKWTREHAQFIGRVIFANFLKLPLERYKDIIVEAEGSICTLGWGGDEISVRYLSGLKTTNKKTKKSPNVVAEIGKTEEGFDIRYTYSGFNKIFLVDKLFERNVYGNESLRSLLFKIKRISSRNEITHQIIEGIISHQRRYLETGDPIDIVPFRQVQLPIDNSWTSRLVNSLSVLTPSGEERPLRWFFQTKRDINKRIIKKLLDKENEELEVAKLERPLTDNQLRDRLEKEYGLYLSRWTVGHCRKDMGIPPAKRRLSGYKYPPISAGFSMPYPLTIESVTRYAPEKSGVYELSIRGTVIYIGSTRNIKKRLREHLGENNKNGHIKDFLNRYSCSFRYIQFAKDWKGEEGRLYNLFVTTYGTPPRCNRVSPVGNTR